MKRKILVTIIAVFIALLLSADCISAGADYLPDVKEFTLSNGLVLMVVERSDSPTVACYRYHKAGSVNERPGITGAAHLAEHMMFKGTKKIGTWNYEAEKSIMDKVDYLIDEIVKERARGLTDYQKMNKAKIDKLWEQVVNLQKEQEKYIHKEEVWGIFDSHGGREMNASTSFDETDYYVYLPSNKLEAWAFIESDRLANPVFREFYAERDVVYEERRMTVDNEPDGILFESLFNAMFSSLPYRHEIGGFASDIESMKRSEVLEFVRKYYSPNNTILVLVGDVDAQEAYQLVNRYFGGIPRQADLKPEFHIEPAQKGERRTEVEYDAQPAVMIGFHGPKPGHPDQYALHVLMSILSDGETGRFHQNIIKEKIAFSCNAVQWNLAYANILYFECSPSEDISTEQLEKSIYQEIDRLKKEPVSQWELEKVKNQNDMNFISLMQDRMMLADGMATAKAWTGDWRNIDNRDKIRSVTAEDVMRVANRYLVKSNRTVSTLIKQ
jgi:predicted Zn-dependent peptidase